MKHDLLSNLNNPAQLEKIYRTDRAAFRQTFNALYPQLEDNSVAGFWHERLNFAREDISWGSRKDFLFVIVASLLAGIVAKLPAIFSINEEFFYPRNIGFIIFPVLSAYFAWKNKLSTGKIAFIAGITLISLIFINSLPN